MLPWGTARDRSSTAVCGPKVFVTFLSSTALVAIACELYRSGKFQSVLTPNYNEGHRDHFHIDIRPDDPRAFLR